MSESDCSQEGSSGRADHDSVPVIDISPWWSSKTEDQQRVVDQVFHTASEVGFFYIKNHGIPEALIERVHAAAHHFFASSEETKMEFYIGKSKISRRDREIESRQSPRRLTLTQKFHGYSPLFSEVSTGAGLDRHDDRPEQICFSEGFDIGYEIRADPTKRPEEELPPDPFSLFGDNQWPAEGECPGFRDDLLEYYAATLQLGREMMRLFAQALGLDPNFFDAHMKHPGAMARLIHYPPQPVKDEPMTGLGAHTDFECFTVLSQSHVPALQVLSQAGEWIQADPIPGTLVVNIGDCLSMWSNRRLKSTIHRVVNLTGEDRYSVPFFFGVDYDTTISVLECCVGQDSGPQIPPFKAGHWVRGKLTKAYVGYDDPPTPEKRDIQGSLASEVDAQV